MSTPHLIPITRTLMRQRYRLLPAKSVSVPHPDDAPHASVDAEMSHRVLIVGNEYAISWGVRTHALALPGQLARELSTRTGVGADIDVVADPGLSITGVLTTLEGQDLDTYDAVIVLTGVGDAYTLLPPVHWVRLFQQLTNALTTSTRITTPITVVGIQPPSTVNICHSKEHGLTDRWAETLNEVTESLCHRHSRVDYVKPPTPLPAALDAVDTLRFKSPAVYKAWAVDLAHHLVPLLPTPRTSGRDLTRDAPQDAVHREAALTALGLLDASPDASLTAIVRRTRDLFTAAAADFSLITEERQRTVATVGDSLGEVRIEESFGGITIREDGPFVVEDAWNDPRIEFETRSRFYAGYPVHAPDGTRIGVLSVSDPNTRPAHTVDTRYLQELAQEIEDQLALSCAPAVTSAAYMS